MQRRPARFRLGPPMAAAAVVLLGLGWLGGYVAGRRAASPQPDGASGVSGSPAFLAAAHVQSAGSDYLAAVAALQRLGEPGQPGDGLAIGQGYEAALAVVETLARTVESSPFAGPDGPALSLEAARARASLDERISELHRGGGAP